MKKTLREFKEKIDYSFNNGFISIEDHNLFLRNYSHYSSLKIKDIDHSDYIKSMIKTIIKTNGL